ncbi:MAG: SIS domain-containing protein [Pseudomonadota bacterium]
MQNQIKDTLQESHNALSALMANTSCLQHIELAASKLIDCLEKGGTVFSCGNGGSMCDAMHFAEELTGRYRKNRRGYAAASISDPSHISCVANDFGYEYIFSRYLESHAGENDVLVGLSTSGSSKNVIQAVDAAKEIGCTSIILSGRETSPLADRSDIYIATPAGQFADRVQELHIKILHIFIELIERHFHPELYSQGE